MNPHEGLSSILRRIEASTELKKALLVDAVYHRSRNTEGPFRSAIEESRPVTCSIIGHRSGSMVKQRNTVAVCGYCMPFELSNWSRCSSSMTVSCEEHALTARGNSHA